MTCLSVTFCRLTIFSTYRNDGLDGNAARKIKVALQLVYSACSRSSRGHSLQSWRILCMALTWPWPWRSNSSECHAGCSLMLPLNYSLQRITLAMQSHVWYQRRMNHQGSFWMYPSEDLTGCWSTTTILSSSFFWSSTEQLIHSLVSCRLDYGNALLYGVPSIQLNRLQTIQNTAARIVSNSFIQIQPHHTCAQVLALATSSIPHWVQDPVVNLQGIAWWWTPVSSRLLRTYSPARTLRSASKHLLESPPTNLKTHSPRSYSVAAPTLWNAVPQPIRSIMTIETFKTQLKTYLLEKAFGQN